jgi:hypothetical protein
MQVPSSGKSPLVHSDYRPSKPHWASEPNVDYEQDEKETPTEAEMESCGLVVLLEERGWPAASV